MQKIEFGSTGLVIEKNGFGCLPIQRISETEAVKLLHKACDGGINFFDTARAYSDSEQKVGAAFSGMRDRIVLATKTGAQTAEGFWRDLETSLRTLKTDYIDIYQFHNPAFCPKPGGEDGLYDAALEAKKQGKIRHISITNHRLAVAQEAIDSGLYASLQFPFSYLAGEQELALVEGCRAHGMGFIAMKGMAGGLLRDGLTAAVWMAAQENVVTIWGVQRESELDQFLQCIREGAELTDERRATIERDRRELCGEFCRGCGYCMPCPAGIEINQCARMSLMLRRAPAQAWLTEEWQAKMHQIEQCRHDIAWQSAPTASTPRSCCRQTTRITGRFWRRAGSKTTVPSEQRAYRESAGRLPALFQCFFAFALSNLTRMARTATPRACSSVKVSSRPAMWRMSAESASSFSAPSMSSAVPLPMTEA